jgi:hypothetical protein
VRAERKWLDTDHHLGGDPALLEKAGRGCGALQAQNLFEIKNAGKIHRTANFILRCPVRAGISYRATSDPFIKSVELVAAQVLLEPDKLCIGSS